MTDQWTKAREAALAALKRGRGCAAGDQPCPFCRWSPDELTPTHEETGCEWLLAAALSALREHGYVVVPDRLHLPDAAVLAGVHMCLCGAAHGGAHVYEAMIAAAEKERE